MFRPLLIIILTWLFTTATERAISQVTVSGRVYDITQHSPLAAVSVMSNSGVGTVTDVEGNYSIAVPLYDSIWFSYLGKPTPKYAVQSIPNRQSFEVALHVSVTELRQVTVRMHNYKLDSIQNREEYAKIFNYRKPGIGSSITPGGGVGLDLDEFINMFRFRRNRNMLAFQQRLEREELDRYIDHRFSRALVIKLTKLHGPDLDTFMKRYRPPLFLVENATEYEFQLYIKNSYEKFHRLQLIMGELKLEDIQGKKPDNE